jgi:hypothetical protein
MTHFATAFNARKIWGTPRGSSTVATFVAAVASAPRENRLCASHADGHNASSSAPHRRLAAKNWKGLIINML